MIKYKYQSAVINWNMKLLLNDINFELTYIRNLNSSGRNTTIDFNERMKKSNKVIKIYSQEGCLPRAIIVAKAYADGARAKEFKKYRQNNGNIQQVEGNKFA